MLSGFCNGGAMIEIQILSTGCNPNLLQLRIWKHIKTRQYIFLLMLFSYLHGPLGSYADSTYLLTGSTLRNLKTNFSLDLKRLQMFSNYPTPDIDYHKPFWISFWGKLEHHKLTAWSVGKSDIIKCNVSSKTGASYGFKAHLENKVFILDPHFVEISRSAFTVTDISVTFATLLKPSHGNLDLVLLIFSCQFLEFSAMADRLPTPLQKNANENRFSLLPVPSFLLIRAKPQMTLEFLFQRW